MAKKRIMIVDHDKDQLAEVVELVTKAGFETVAFSNAKHAVIHLDQYGKGNLRMIVAEAVMPDVDGFGFLKEVKKRTTVKDLPFLFLTHAHDTSVLISAIEQGAVDYFFKPLKKELFVAKIRSMVAAFDDHIRTTNTLMADGLMKRPLEDIIALCEHESLNGFIQISRPDGMKGVITFVKGLPDKIYIENSNGEKLSGDAEAFETMHGWHSGEFVVRRGNLEDY
jgi:CheY-like chemotaxis protein